MQYLKTDKSTTIIALERLVMSTNAKPLHNLCRPHQSIRHSQW